MKSIIANGNTFGVLLNQTNITKELKVGGYATRYVRKWHLGLAKQEYTSAYRGFDTFCGYIMMTQRTTLSTLFTDPENWSHSTYLFTNAIENYS